MSTVHFLRGGFALCNKPGVPGSWGPGHKWVAFDHDGEQVNCEGCKRVAADPLVSHPLVAGQPEAWQPPADQHAALVDLLRRAMAWRRQGAPSHWKTIPSQALALEVDRVVDRFPALAADITGGQALPEPGTPRERLRELVPPALVDSYHEDEIIHAAFATAAYGGLSRESALIRIVQEQRRDRGRLLQQLVKMQTEGLPDVVLQVDHETVARLRPIRDGQFEETRPAEPDAKPVTFEGLGDPDAG